MEANKFILKNKPIPKEAQLIIDKLTENNEHILFVIVGDLALNGRYSETEHLIQEAIDRLIAGKTTLMIAHRLSTLRREITCRPIKTNEKGATANA